MPSGERALTPEVEEALRRLRNESLPWWHAYGPVVPPRRQEFFLEFADTPVAIEHGLQAVPDGMLIVKADGPIYAAPGVPWTKELAFLQASRAHTRGRFIFYTTRGDEP